MIRLLAVLIFALCSSAALAQATFPIADTVDQDEQFLVLLAIDFTSTAGAGAAIDFAAAGNSATEGLRAVMLDLDAVAANGSAGAFGTGSDAGTGSFNFSVTSGAYDNVRQFVISIESFTGGGPVGFTGTVSATLPSGAIASLQTLRRSNDDFAAVSRLFNRAIRGEQSVDSTGNQVTHEFMVDFGGTPQTATFYFNAEGDIAGSVTLHEVLANGTTSTLTTLTNAGADWSEEGNVTTSSRSGTVRFRVTSSTADLDFNWFAVFPSTVSVEAFGSLTISGTLTNDQSRLHRFTLDFGADPTSYMFQLADGTVTLSGMTTFTVALVDVNTLATTGSDPGIYGSIDEASTTAAHTGVRQFAYFAAHSGVGTATYTITFEFSTQSVTSTGFQTINDPTAFTNIFNVGVTADHEFAAPAASQSFDFQVNFGAVSQVADFYLSGGGEATGNVELFEILENGTAVSRGVATWTGDDSDEVNGSSSARTGIVRFRVTINGTTASSYDFSVIFADNVTVGLIPGPGGKKKDSGCSTGDHGSHWLALFGALAMLGLATRLRNARA